MRLRRRWPHARGEASDARPQQPRRPSAASALSLPDFVHTVVQERARFQRELKLLADYEAACVVVEATLGDILAHRYRSRAHPNSVLGAVLSLLQDFRVPVLFCGDRPSARQFAEAYLLRCYRKFQT